jgi:hypothetical protein
LDATAKADALKGLLESLGSSQEGS